MNTVTAPEPALILLLLLLLLLLATLPGVVTPVDRDERANMRCEQRGGRGLVKEMGDHTKPDDMERTLNMR